MILDDYEKEAEQQNPGCTLHKDFRYPPILPIVFYGGQKNWKASRNFLFRTGLHEAFKKYIPKFEYIVVDLHRYNPQYIMEFKDALSLVMLADRMETVKDEGEIKKRLEQYTEELKLKIPKGLTKLLEDAVGVLLGRDVMRR
jgi:predicted amino acid-binding ACT domain protein